MAYALAAMVLASPSYDLFISYAHADRDRIDPLLRALRGRVRVWLDEREIQDFDGITLRIGDGLRSSKAVLAFFSRAYATRRACLWELTAAFVAASTRQGEPGRSRLLVVVPDTAIDHVPLPLRDCLRPSLPETSDTESWEGLADEITQRLARFDGALGSPPPPPIWYGLEPVGLARTIGRERDLWTLHADLCAADVGITSGDRAPRAVQVRGMPGVGKTLLVEAYAELFGPLYPGGIFFLAGQRGESPSAPGAALEAVGRDRALRLQVLADIWRRKHGGIASSESGDTHSDAEHVLALAIQGAAGPCLWIIDDLPGGLSRSQIKDWFPPHPNARVIVTTRSLDYGAWGHCLDLDVLSEDDALALLTLHRQPESPQEEREARLLVEDLGRHPLAVDVAGAHLALTRLRSFFEYRASLRALDHDIFADSAGLGPRLATDHVKNVTATLSQCIEATGAEAHAFLALATALAPAAIPDELADAAFRAEFEDGTTRLERGIDELLRGSLARRGAEGAATVLHELVLRTARLSIRDVPERERLKSGARRELALRAGRVQSYCSRRQFSIFIPHARHLVSETEGDDRLALLRVLEASDFDAGLYLSAATLARDWLDGATRVHGTSHLETLHAKQGLAAALFHAGGRRREAVRLQEELVAELIPGCVDHRAAERELAFMYRGTGQFERAISILQRLLADAEARGDLDSDESWTFRSYLASVLQESRFDLARAQTLQQDVQRKRRASGDPLGLAEITLNLGNTFAIRALEEAGLETPDGRALLSSARREHERALELAESEHMPLHFITIVKRALATTLGLEGERTRAKQLLIQALNDARERWGDDHVATQSVAGQLAEL